MTKSISSLFPAPRRHQTQEELRLTGRGASFSYKHKVTEQVSLSPASPPLPLHFCMVSSLACALLKNRLGKSGSQLCSVLGGTFDKRKELQNINRLTFCYSDFNIKFDYYVTCVLSQRRWTFVIENQIPECCPRLWNFLDMHSGLMFQHFLHKNNIIYVKNIQKAGNQCVKI